jgi:hypothetical protein
MTPAPPERIDDLYQLPPDAFTTARDALAAELKAAGDREGAARVKGLRRPSRAAWVVNRLVKAEPDLVEELLGAGGELRQAHRQAASGKGSSELRAAAAAERRAVEALLGRAAAILGGPPSPAIAEAIRNTLHSASSDDVARDLVTSGRVVEEMRTTGFPEV